MTYYTDGVVRRALAYMGYSTLQTNLFMDRAYPSDRTAMISDALAAGFDVEAAVRMESTPVDSKPITKQENRHE